MKSELLRIALLVGWVGILFVTADLGTFNIDEVHYLLAAERFTSAGTFTVPNGFAEFRHDLLLFFHPQPLESLPGQADLSTFIPPLYTFPAAAFYSIAGITGLFVMNALAYVVAVILAMRIARNLAPEGHGELAEWLTLAAFVGGSFFSGYAVAIVNHALTLALVLGALCLHPLMRSVKDSRALLLPFASGLLIAFAFGVRLQHIISIGVLGAFCLLESKRPVAHLLAFAAGVIPPVALVSIINKLRFDSWNPLSYGVSAQAKLVPLLGDIASNATLQLTGMIVMIVLLLFMAIFHRQLSTLIASRVSHFDTSSSTLVTVAVSIPFVLLLVPPFGGHFAERVLGLFPLAGPDSEWRGLFPPYLAVWGGVRTPLLASAPLVLCGLLSPMLLPASLRTGRAWMLWAVAWSHVLFVCLLTNNGGYFMNQRYLMEAAALALILFAVISSGFLQQLARRDLLIGGAIAIVACMMLLYFAMPGRTLGMPTTVLDHVLGRFIPIAFALVMLVAVILFRLGKPIAKVMLGLTLPYCLFAPLVHHVWYDMAHEHEYRRSRREVAEALAPIIPHGSLLIVYGGQREPAGRLKEHTDVWVADALRTQWAGVPELIEETMANQWRTHIFLTDTGMPDEVRAWLREHAELRRVMDEPFALHEVTINAEAGSGSTTP